MKVIFASSVLADGPMGVTKTLAEDKLANRLKFIQAHFGDSALAPVMIDSMHGATIRVATTVDATRAFPGCDGLFTTEPNLPIVITHQDCVPIVIRDTAGTFVSVVHAGWKGTLAGILPRAIQLCVDHGKLVKDLMIDFGPCIQPCHFIVKEDVAEKFRHLSLQTVTNTDPGEASVNLLAALRTQALSAGVNPASMKFSRDCTFHTPGLASWRRDHNPEANMITVAMLVK
ncbi:MAG: polyphenol oxidase family protein [Patescibacteria group bacterium]|jgi:hypothetical protein